MIVLRSVAEFSGMGSTRTGVAWSRDRYLLRVLFDPRFSSPISGLDVVATEAALASRVWAEAVRRQLAEDGGWLAHALAPLGTVIDDNVARPFRCLVTDRAEELAAGLAGHGVDVLVVGPAEGHPGGLRIAAPRVSERAAFTAALHGLTAVAQVWNWASPADRSSRRLGQPPRGRAASDERRTTSATGATSDRALSRPSPPDLPEPAATAPS